MLALALTLSVCGVWPPAQLTGDSEQAPAYAASKAAPNVAGLWHTRFEGQSPGYPHELLYDLGEEATICRVGYLPRQDLPATNGNVKRFRVEIDGQVHAQADAWPTGWTWVDVGRKGRRVRFVALAERNGQPWAAAEELRVEARCIPTSPTPALKFDYPAEPIKEGRAKGFRVYPGGHDLPCAIETGVNEAGEPYEFRRCAGLDYPYPVQRLYDFAAGERVQLSITQYGEGCESAPLLLPPKCWPCIQDVNHESYAHAAARCGP